MNKKGRPGAEVELEPISGGLVDSLLIFGAVLTVALVAFWFKLDVNRVFDVPKALALKVGGCGIFLVWLLWGLFGPGFPWKSIRVFLGPVAALTAAVTVSTFLSFDVPVSLFGVYERQFGLQGFLGCIGLFVVTATCLRSRRGAVAGLSALMLIGGVLGSYALLQSQGHDPYGFFSKPHNKVYSLLGNATFAGNALALIFPMSLILALVAAAKTLYARARLETAGLTPGEPALLLAYFFGVAMVLGLQILPGYFATESTIMGAATKEAVFKATVGLSLVLSLVFATAGSWGPEWGRVESVRLRRLADAAAAGALLAASTAIAIGLLCTRTRGAWVGTFVAIAGGLVLLPFLFKDDRERFRRMVTVGGGGLALVVGGLVVFMLAAPNHLYTATIKSIPYAFSPDHTVYGKGQGTRPYLWKESPRVLLDHGATLDRKYGDMDELAAKVKRDAIAGVDLEVPASTAEGHATDRTWRTLAVWPFGIGIETYRYAFMSHKSKKLEALDPMTNHDNPHNNYLYVLTSFGICGLLAYVWLLWRLLSVSACRFAGWKHRLAPAEDVDENGVESREARAIAFGVLTSFFSYAFYSIAGFDSVACSVFLYFFLGCAAVYFNPAGDETPRNILVNLRLRWLNSRGRPLSGVSLAAPMDMSIGVAAIVGGFLLQSMAGGWNVNRAEQAFVGERTAAREKLENIKEAIRLNPDESYYKQNLGSTLADYSRRYRQQASRMRQQGKETDAKAYELQADQLAKEGEAALYASLDHAWAPENVFISLFQLYYTQNQMKQAEYALERALQHSPHLGAVRANLAILKLERRGYAEALKDCEWVLEVDPTSAVALRTCGRASYFLGKLDQAKDYLDRAAAANPKDGAVKAYLEDLAKAKAGVPTTTTTGAEPPL